MFKCFAKNTKLPLQIFVVSYSVYIYLFLPHPSTVTSKLFRWHIVIYRNGFDLTYEKQIHPTLAEIGKVHVNIGCQSLEDKDIS